MLPVQSEGDAALLINLIEHPVSVILHRCSENYHLIDLTHLFEELITPRPHPESSLACGFIIVDERLIQIQHQGVPILRRRFQIRRLDSLQLLVASYGRSTHPVQRQLLCCHF